MYKQLLLLLLLFSFSTVWSQEELTAYQQKKVVYSNSGILIDSIAINPNTLKIQTKNQVLDTTFYKFDAARKKITFTKEITDTIVISYQRLPHFLTKTYTIYDPKKIVPNEAGQLITFQDKSNKKTSTLFNGLQTNGNISRAVTVGNNQNTVLNSNLDLQVSGKLSDQVTLRASIQDRNIPLQEGGYSQKLDEFDQIFIELASKNWNIRAGDLFLENRTTSFLNFNKKVQGLNTTINWGNTNHKTNIFAAASLVRGQYAKSNFVGQEGNQGPYKLRGSNGELYVLVISGSERVFINGILQERGENKDYIVDYNAGEIIFNATKPITSEMRIVIEYQYSDRNFTRFLSYGGVQHDRERFKIGAYVYSESDVKNQPLQQSLSEQQIQVLQNAGDDPSLMQASSAFVDTYSENKILYRKMVVGGSEVFVFSTDATQILYQVKFSLIGNNQGNYILASSNAIGKIYEYIAPVNGVPQGNYEPIIQLIAPIKLQVATLVSSYQPTEKTTLESEIAISNHDLNLYSNLDDNNNKGIATKLHAKQQFKTPQFTFNAFTNVNYVQENFKPIERLYNIEFNRDWNVLNPKGNQSLIIGGVDFFKNKSDSIKWIVNGKYQFEKLDYAHHFSGSKQVFQALVKNKNVLVQTQGSYMKSSGELNDSDFFRNRTITKYHYKQNYIGGSFRHENNKEFNTTSQSLTNISQRFTEFGHFIGRGDSTKVFTEIGYLIRNNDSLQNGLLKRVNQSFSSYLKSQILKNEDQNLSLFINYRNLKFNDGRTSQPSINSRLSYTDSYFGQLLQINTFYETSSGTIAQQDFTFLEVEPGRGVYMWNDYNNNNIQELQEFEIATFPDLAKYVKIFLPNQVFVRTYQNKWSQTLTFNGSVWQNASGLRKLLSKFYNQTSFIIDKKIKRSSNHFEWNPFTYNENELIGLNQSFRNNLFYNKGKQRHSVTYTFTTNSVKNLLNFGSQENQLKSHQLQYAHLVKKYWLFQAITTTTNSKSISDNYSTRNFTIQSWDLNPKITYLFSKNASWEVFYKNSSKENTIGTKESLKQNQWGTAFIWNSEKGLTSSGNFSYYDNQFEGNQNSPVGFQLLEGLQAGKNMTWTFNLQKNITQFLDIAINYQGRKSETSKTIHTGTIQLRAFFKKMLKTAYLISKHSISEVKKLHLRKYSKMKNFYIITTLLLSLVSFSQLSNKHWIPPLHSRDDTAIQDHYLYLSTPETTPFQVTVKTGDGNPIAGSPFTISRTNPSIILIGNGQPSSMFLDQTDLNVVVSDKGLILESTKDFYASFRMRAQNHAETLISKGKPGIGTSFRLGSTPQGGEINIRNFVASVMATQDNTTITLSDYDTDVQFVTLNGNIGDDSQTFVLNKGQSIVFSGYTDVTANWTGFIGALVVADKPIAVNTGNATGGVTNNGSDFTLDQIVSAAQIGTEYIFIEGNGLPEMEQPLIIANEDNTEIYVNGNTTPIAILNAGDYTLIPNSYYQGTNNKNIYIRSSKPVFAYQLIGGAASSPTSGLNFIPPLSCFFQNSVYIPSINSIGNTDYSADLMVLTYGSSTITVNGNPINPATSEAVLGNTDWVTYRISGYTGDVNVISTGPLAVGVFGASGAAGYAGYYSGFGSAPTDTDVTVCSSATKDLFESIDGNPEPGGTWTIPAGGAPLNGNIFDPALNLPGEYIYTFTKNCNTSLTTISVKANVSIVPGGNPGISTTKNTCVNESSFDLFTLLGTGVTPGGIWSPALASGTSLFDPAVDPSGTYTYTLPANSVCPELSSSVVVTNNPLPTVSSIATLEQCDDNLDGDDTNGKATFNLNTKTTEVLNGQTGVTVTYHLTASEAIANTGSITTYYGGNNTIHVRLTNTVTGCYNVTSFEVKVNVKPVVSNTITLTQCDDDTDAITDFNLTEANGLLSTQSNLTFAYFSTQTEAENNTNPITNTTVYSSANNGVVWARVTNEFGCYRTAKVNLIVSTTQVPAGFQFTLNECDEFISLSDPDFDGIDYFNLNPATTAILNLFPGNQNLTVTYYTSQANALAEINAITTLTNFRNTIPHSQTIWVRIDSSLNNDCIGLGPYVTLTVNPLPNFDLPTNKILCVQPTTGTGLLPIDATPTTPGSYSYVWTPANTNSNPAIYNITQAGTYKVVVTNTTTGCTKQDQIQVTVSSAPASVTAVLNNALFAPGLSSIRAITSGGFGDYEYSLDTIEWQDYPVFNNLENGSYTIYVRDKNGCGNLLISNTLQTISYPNYFTPNGDSYNDTWNIVGLTPDFEAKIYIFDRYGKLLKEVNPYQNNGWDGTYNGNLMPSTDYWFRIEYKQNGVAKEFRSHFSLKR